MIFAITDIETTGSYASGNAITEIAVCLHDGKKILREYHSLVNPGVSLPYYITALTGITDQMLANAPSFEDIADELLSFFGDTVFVAHSVNFDYSFIHAAFKETGRIWKPKKLCTVRLARKAFPGFRSYSLGNLCNELEIRNLTPHRALGDARATCEVFSKSIELVDEKVIQKMMGKGAGDNFLPQNLDAREYVRLPEQPGVYFFLNEKGVPIYIGKAINLKARVRSHFLGDKTSSRLQGFFKEIHHIEYTLTGNEMIALLLEDSLIRKSWPKYNQAQKNRPGKYGVFQYSDQNGFLRLAVNTSFKSVAPIRTFHSSLKARDWLLRMAESNGLDFRALGIDLTDGKTPWPDRDEHNRRLIDALENEKIEGSSCIFYSQGRGPGETAFVWIERGNLKGYGFCNSEEAIVSADQLEAFLEPLPHSETTSAVVRSFLDDPRGMNVMKIASTETAV